MCEYCKETNCAISKRITANIEGTPVEVFARIRFDMENNQIDMQLGVAKPANTPEETNDHVYAYDWSDSLDIINCPVCGRPLPLTEEQLRKQSAQKSVQGSIGGEMVKRMIQSFEGGNQ